MQRRAFLRMMAAGAMASGVRWNAGAETDARPNIVFLLTDDQAYNTLGCAGNRQVKTPNLDRLAREGVVFDAHYDTTSICMASRATIMTGMYEYKTGCNFTRGGLPRKTWSLSYPVLLRNAGYYTGFAGKFGFGVSDAEKDRGWSKNENMPMDAFDVWKGWPGQGFYETAKNEFVRSYAQEYPHVTRALGAFGCGFIRDAAARGGPFCLSISFKAPHAPNTPDPLDAAVYEGVEWATPPNYDEAGAAGLPQQAKSGRQYLRIGAYRPASYQSSMRKHQQLIYGVDVAVAMIRDELNRQGVAGNTVILFTSDNGYSLGSHAFGDKVLPYEEASRAPLILYDPRRPASGSPRRCAAVTGNIDMAPTILDLAGLPIPDNMDGKSLVGLLDNPGGRVRESMAILNVWGSVPTHEMTIVTERHRYMNWFYAGEPMPAAEELYDRVADPYELRNLAGEPANCALLEEMRALFDREVERWKQQCVPTNGYPAYGTLFDRRVPWEEKAPLIRESDRRSYYQMISGKGRKEKGGKSDVGDEE